MVRGALFSILGPGGVEGKRVLDLYAGTGALGLEALLRGARFVEFVEIDRGRCEAIRAAVEREELADRCRVHRGRAERITGRLAGGYDIVFIDPPYADDPFERIFDRLERGEKLAEHAVVFAEHDRRRHLADKYPGLRLEETRIYGDTAVSIYRRSSASTFRLLDDSHA